MRVHLHSKGHLLTPVLKEIRWTRAKHLLQWHAKNGHKNILFMEEKIFTIKEQYNNQYNKIYAEMGAHVYQDDVLLGVVKPLNMTVFNSQKWVFQQDSAPAHKTKMTQEWLRRNVLACISAKVWPSGSPDLNPRDYKPWAVLENMLCRKYHNNVDSLKKTLVKAAAEIPLETVHAAIAEWLEHLKACIGAEGGHFEGHYYKYKLKTIVNKLFGSKSGCFVSLSF
jgi:inhibitor of nuclear factor kappa-B kinase subunit alpha